MNQQFFSFLQHFILLQNNISIEIIFVLFRGVWFEFFFSFPQLQFHVSTNKAENAWIFFHFESFSLFYVQNIIREYWNEIAWIVCAFYIVNNKHIVLFGNPLNRINHFHKQSYESSLNFKLKLDDLIKFFFILFRILKFVYDNFVYR